MEVSARFTDLKNRPMVVESYDDPWIEVLSNAEGDLDWVVTQPWDELAAQVEADSIDHQARRDYADYVRLTRESYGALDHARFAMESAFEDEKSPSTLLAWSRLLDESERQAIEALHGRA